jgi:predicted TIM-barrel fold metal-dependent hydrolase
MIIDCHTHIFSEDMRTRRAVLCEQDEDFSSIYGNPKARMIGAEDLIASMNETGVDRSVICGFSWTSCELCSLHNEYLLDCVSRYPDRLIAFVALSFANAERAERELDKAIRAGAKGVGEVAFYSGEMTSEDIDRMTPVLGLMEKEGIFLLLHTNEEIGHSYPGKGETPLKRFHELASRFPGLYVILAHWGGGLPFYELMPEVAKGMTRVYYDTAASPFIYSHGIYAAVSGIIGPERILFGSDFPLISPGRYFAEMERSGLSEEGRRKILGLNFLRLLKQERV